MKRINVRRRGFTLIEIAIAIAIIAVLAVTVLLGARYLIKDSKVAKTQEAVDGLAKAYMLAMVADTATTVATGPATPAGNCNAAGAAGAGGTMGNWAKYYPSGVCTAVDGTSYGVAGVNFTTTGIAVKVNCADGCDTIYTKLAGSYKNPTAALTLGGATCATTAPAAAAGSFIFCAQL